MTALPSPQWPLDRPMPTPDVLLENLAFVGKQMEDMAVNKHATPYERTIACAIEVTIANLLEIFKQASMSWPAVDREAPR